MKVNKDFLLLLKNEIAQNGINDLIESSLDDVYNIKEDCNQYKYIVGRLNFLYELRHQIIDFKLNDKEDNGTELNF
jgi:hypothetical protein